MNIDTPEERPAFRRDCPECRKWEREWREWRADAMAACDALAAERAAREQAEDALRHLCAWAGAGLPAPGERTVEQMDRGIREGVQAVIDVEARRQHVLRGLLEEWQEAGASGNVTDPGMLVLRLSRLEDEASEALERLQRRGDLLREAIVLVEHHSGDVEIEWLRRAEREVTP